MFPFHSRKTSVRQKAENTIHQGAGQSCKKNRATKKAGEHTQVWPVKLRFPKISGFWGRGQQDAEAAPPWVWGPPPPTRMQTVSEAQPAPHPAAGESASANTQGKPIITEGTEPASELLSAPCPTSTPQRGSPPPRRPHLALEEPPDIVAPSRAIPANGGRGSQEKSARPSTAPRAPRICLIEH